MSWKDYFNTAGLPDGSFRSIAGYAAESLVIGRAMQCGYNLFFKAWRDSPYDGVLDHNGVLFRVEIKGTTTSSLTVTSGGRAGAQINREAEDRTHIINKNEVDMLIGINNQNGDCYVIHTEILHIFNQQSLSLEKIDIFKEKWLIFKGLTLNSITFTTEDIKTGFTCLSTEKIIEISSGIGIDIPSNDTILEMDWPGFRGGKISFNSIIDYLALEIWKKILA